MILPDVKINPFLCQLHITSSLAINFMTRGRNERRQGYHLAFKKAKSAKFGIFSFFRIWPFLKQPMAKFVLFLIFWTWQPCAKVVVSLSALFPLTFPHQSSPQSKLPGPGQTTLLSISVVLNRGAAEPSGAVKSPRGVAN